MSRVSVTVRDNNVSISTILKDADIAIIGILNDNWRTISGTSSSLTYRDYLPVDSVFLIKAHELLTVLIKEASLENTLTIQSDPVKAISTKAATVKDAEFAITSVLESALVYAVNFSNKFCVDGNIGALSIKHLGIDASKFQIASSMGSLDFYKFLGEISSSFQMIGTISEISVDKSSEIDICIKIIANLNERIAKYFENTQSKMIVAGAMDIVSVRYRLMQDLAGLTMGDIYSWTMDELYMTTEE